MPSEVALSGNRRRRLSATESSSASAPASVAGGGAPRRSPEHADISGPAAAETSTVMASRRLSEDLATATSPLSLPATLGISRPLVEDHPVQPELVLHLGEARCEECLFDRHEHLAVLRQYGVDALRLGIAVDAQRQIRAAHWLRVRDVGAHQIVVADSHP